LSGNHCRPRDPWLEAPPWRGQAAPWQDKCQWLMISTGQREIKSWVGGLFLYDFFCGKGVRILTEIKGLIDRISVHSPLYITGSRKTPYYLYVFPCFPNSIAFSFLIPPVTLCFISSLLLLCVCKMWIVLEAVKDADSESISLHNGTVHLQKN
jgi:hypothetical protein